MSTPMDPGQRKKLWQVISWSAAVCIGISAGGYFLGIAPAIAHVSERNADLAELANRQEQATQAKKDLITTRKRIEQAKKEVEELPLRLEPAAVVNGRLNRLAEAASAA